MSVSQAISSHIPYLRRFARALSGTQASGDAYVLATLESIVSNPSTIQMGAHVRTSLYRIFLKVWGATPIDDLAAVSPPPDEAGARRVRTGAAR